MIISTCICLFPMCKSKIFDRIFLKYAVFDADYITEKHFFDMYDRRGDSCFSDRLLFALQSIEILDLIGL